MPQVLTGTSTQFHRWQWLRRSCQEAQHHKLTETCHHLGFSAHPLDKLSAIEVGLAYLTNICTPLSRLPHNSRKRSDCSSTLVNTSHGKFQTAGLMGGSQLCNQQRVTSPLYVSQQPADRRRAIELLCSAETVAAVGWMQASISTTASQQ